MNQQSIKDILGASLLKFLFHFRDESGSPVYSAISEFSNSAYKAAKTPRGLDVTKLYGFLPQYLLSILKSSGEFSAHQIDILDKLFFKEDCQFYVQISQVAIHSKTRMDGWTVRNVIEELERLICSSYSSFITDNNIFDDIAVYSEHLVKNNLKHDYLTLSELESSVFSFFKSKQAA